MSDGYKIVQKLSLKLIIIIQKLKVLGARFSVFRESEPFILNDTLYFELSAFELKTYTKAENGYSCYDING